MSFFVTRLHPGQTLELRARDEEMVLALAGRVLYRQLGYGRSIDWEKKKCVRRPSFYSLSALR